MTEQEKNGLNLEDILKEFAADAPEGEADRQVRSQMPIAAEPPLEQRLKSMFAEPEPEPEPAPEPEAKPEPEPEENPAMTGETRVVDTEAIREAAGREPSQTDTQRFEPLGKLPQEQPEPFGEGWEPEYEAPMGEYTAPEPIPFRPKSRLRELKKKLVAGPERRYYQLSELGVGKLQAAMFLSLLVVVMSFVSIGLHGIGFVSPERMRLLVFGELFAMVLSALIGWQRIFDGLESLVKGRFTPDAMLVLTFFLCIADGVFCLQEVRVPFCAAFCLEVSFSVWAEYERRTTEMGQMDTLRRANRLHRIAKAPDCYEGRPGFYMTDGEVEDFMDTYQAPATPQRVQNWVCALMFLACVAVGGLTGYLQGISAALRVSSACMLAAMPASAWICQTRPMAVLERRLHKLGVVLCGWRGVKAMSGSAVVPLTDLDLFPVGSVKINGMKFFRRADSDQLIAYTAAIMERADNALTPLFRQLLSSRNGRQYVVEQYRCYAGGLGGTVFGESVLLGSAQFLHDMGVEIPEGTRVSQAVYVAVEGELCAVFALAFGKMKGVSAGLGTLCGYRGLTPVLTGDNFLMNEGFLRSKFSVSTRRIAFPGAEQRETVEQWQPDPEASVPCALTVQEGLPPFAFAITGARSLRSCCNLGLAMHILAGVLGIVIVALLTLVEGSQLLTPVNLLLYQLAWCVPGVFITSWTRFL